MAIDNLGKGAAAQGLQNLNVMFGFPRRWASRPSRCCRRFVMALPFRFVLPPGPTPMRSRRCSRQRWPQALSCRGWYIRTTSGSRTRRHSGRRRGSDTMDVHGGPMLVSIRRRLGVGRRYRSGVRAGRPRWLSKRCGADIHRRLVPAARVRVARPCTVGTGQRAPRLVSPEVPPRCRGVLEGERGVRGMCAAGGLPTASNGACRIGFDPTGRVRGVR